MRVCVCVHSSKEMLIFLDVQQFQKASKMPICYHAIYVFHTHEIRDANCVLSCKYASSKKSTVQCCHIISHTRTFNMFSCAMVIYFSSFVVQMYLLVPIGQYSKNVAGFINERREEININCEFNKEKKKKKKKTNKIRSTPKRTFLLISISICKFYARVFVCMCVFIICHTECILRRCWRFFSV